MTRWTSNPAYYCTELYNTHQIQIHATLLGLILQRTNSSSTLVLVEHGASTLDVFLHEKQFLHTSELLRVSWPG